jgi:hypothetical protein
MAARIDAFRHTVRPHDLGVVVGTDPYGTDIRATTTPRSRREFVVDVGEDGRHA